MCDVIVAYEQSLKRTLETTESDGIRPLQLEDETLGSVRYAYSPLLALSDDGHRRRTSASATPVRGNVDGGSGCDRTPSMSVPVARTPASDAAVTYDCLPDRTPPYTVAPMTSPVLSTSAEKGTAAAAVVQSDDSEYTLIAASARRKRSSGLELYAAHDDNDGQGQSLTEVLRETS